MVLKKSVCDGVRTISVSLRCFRQKGTGVFIMITVADVDRFKWHSGITYCLRVPTYLIINKLLGYPKCASSARIIISDYL
jgi:hypothetical protein